MTSSHVREPKHMWKGKSEKDIKSCKENLNTCERQPKEKKVKMTSSHVTWEPRHINKKPRSL